LDLKLFIVEQLTQLSDKPNRIVLDFCLSDSIHGIGEIKNHFSVCLSVCSDVSHCCLCPVGPVQSLL